MSRQKFISERVFLYTWSTESPEHLPYAIVVSHAFHMHCRLISEDRVFLGPFCPSRPQTFSWPTRHGSAQELKSRHCRSRVETIRGMTFNVMQYWPCIGVPRLPQTWYYCMAAHWEWHRLELSHIQLDGTLPEIRTQLYQALWDQRGCHLWSSSMNQNSPLHHRQLFL